MTTPDTTTAEPTIEEDAGASTQSLETTPAAAATSEVKAEAPASETVTVEPAAVEESTVVEPAGTAVAETPVAETALVPAAAEPAAEPAAEEDPQTTVFSLVTFFLAALPVIGVILNAIAVARAGKEGFDLWIARWGLALAIIETIGALALVGLGYYLGMLTTGAA